MSSDDLLDVLSSLPNHFKRYSGEVADFVDKNIERAASSVRDNLSSSPWLPDALRAHMPLPPSASSPLPMAELMPASTYERVSAWIARNKMVIGAAVVAVGYSSYRVHRARERYRKSRRARRARNGGRTEVVVIAGSPNLPVTKSLALDLERRGFIVYVVCNNMDDEVMVQGLSRPDIRALSMDIQDPSNVGTAIDKFASYLQTPHAAVPGAKPNYLTLSSVVLIPSLHYETSPIAAIPPSAFAGVFNTHLLHPILTIQSFLPLLTSRLQPDPNPASPRVLILTPSIISSINPPFHAPEATVCSALAAFTEVLAAELRPLQIPVTQVQMGTFDFSPFSSSHPAAARHPSGLLPPTPPVNWPQNVRAAYARNYVSQSTSPVSPGRLLRGLRPSSLRELHHAVFDVLDGSETSGTIRVGLGANVYGLVGRWMPRNMVSWMMGIRQVDQLAVWEAGENSGAEEDDEDDDDEEEGEGEGQEGRARVEGKGEGAEGSASEFVSVGKEGLHGSNVWKEE